MRKPAINQIYQNKRIKTLIKVKTVTSDNKVEWLWLTNDNINGSMHVVDFYYHFERFAISSKDIIIVMQMISPYVKKKLRLSNIQLSKRCYQYLEVYGVNGFMDLKNFVMWAEFTGAFPPVVITKTLLHDLGSVKRNGIIPKTKGYTIKLNILLKIN